MRFVDHSAVELERLEAALQDGFRARERPQTDADLAERGQRDGAAVARPVRLVQRHAPLRERQRFLAIAGLEYVEIGVDLHQHRARLDSFARSDGNSCDEAFDLRLNVR